MLWLPRPVRAAAARFHALQPLGETGHNGSGTCTDQERFFCVIDNHEIDQRTPATRETAPNSAGAGAVRIHGVATHKVSLYDPAVQAFGVRSRDISRPIEDDLSGSRNSSEGEDRSIEGKPVGITQGLVRAGLR
jgi:hypothetical protein